MKKTRKLVSLLLGAAMILSLAACGGSGGGNPGNTGTPSGGSNTSANQPSSGGGSDLNWPTKTVTLLCGYSAGGSSDLGCRYLADALGKELGTTVIVENIPGSGSWLAWNQLLQNTDPDGYTFALINLSAMYGHYDATNPRETTIDDFQLLANHVIDYQCLAIRADETRFSDYASLIEYSKANGLVVACATAGITSGDASIAKMMEKEYGSKITVIPVDGSGDAETMFLAGEVDFLIGNVGDMMDGEANGFKVIVVYGDDRSSFLPDVPTSKELGLGDDYVSFSARGYAYMPGVDQAIVDRMIEALTVAFDDPDYQANMAAMGAELKLYTGDEYKTLLLNELDQRLELWDVQK